MISRIKKYIALLLVLVLALSVTGCKKSGSGGDDQGQSGKTYEQYYGTYKLKSIGGEVFEGYSTNTIEATVAKLRMEGTLGVFVIGEESYADYDGKHIELKFEEQNGAYYARENADVASLFGSGALIYSDGDTLTIECSNVKAVYSYENVSRYNIDPSRYYGTFVFKSIRDASDEAMNWKDLSEDPYNYSLKKDSKIVLGETCLAPDYIYDGSPVKSCEMDYEAMVLTLITEYDEKAYLPVVFTEQGMQILENPNYFLLVKEQ
ncbi:MAG: hypothetical protein J5528_01260 [Firmicutes bacterium]|nr:hypothetical protein [Bacillota bacterium]